MYFLLDCYVHKNEIHKIGKKKLNEATNTILIFCFWGIAQNFISNFVFIMFREKLHELFVDAK